MYFRCCFHQSAGGAFRGIRGSQVEERLEVAVEASEWKVEMDGIRSVAHDATSSAHRLHIAAGDPTVRKKEEGGVQ